MMEVDDIRAVALGVAGAVFAVLVLVAAGGWLITRGVDPVVLLLGFLVAVMVGALAIAAIATWLRREGA